ncbi:hypothetical protein [Chitinophaga sp. Cy-1792]|uniref:hypothetical protein n=1 Tax=Chitinophaga sp. Cy-1792 TaxID=2608339 RepID=UPI00142023A8|nr:hypothetical protein [Chitinophaga sp. Cy-1792]NIG55659.1 hypothetical protein [Chitinophaga sp. Cy-1792]
MNSKNLFRLATPLLFSMIILADAGSASAQQISISPARITFQGDPGQTVSETVLISNSGETDFEFIAGIKDWKRDSMGTKLYQPSGTLPHSNAGQVRLDATNFTVAPHQKKVITVYMDIPQTSGDSIATNSMLFFTQTNPSERKTPDNKGIGIKIGYEFGIQVFYNPSSARKGELEFDSMNYSEKAEGQQVSMLVIGYHNTGQINKTGQLRVELTNKNTGEEIKLKAAPVAIMPLGYQYIQVPLPENLPKGQYLAIGMLDAGAGYRLKIAEKNFDVR